MSYLIALVSFLLPFVFLPITSEGFEFPKLLFFYLSVAILLFAWAVKIVRQRKITIFASPFYLPIFLLFLVFAASTFFSVARFTSLLGAFPDFHWNFIEVCALSLFFFVVVNNLDKKGAKILQKTLVTAAFFLALWTFLSFFVFTPAADNVATINFSFLTFNFLLPLTPLGSLIILAVFLLVVSPLILVWTKESLAKILAKEAKIYHGVFLGFSILALILIFFVAFLGLPWTRSITNKITKVEIPETVALGSKPSWLISATALRDAPILGSGPSTFLIDFVRYRPFLMLTTNFWDTFFVKPGNEIFEIIATTGILGFLAFLVLVYKVIVSFRQREDWGVLGSLGVLFLSLCFASATIVSAFLLFLLLALFSVQVNQEKKLFDFNFAERFTSIPFLFLGASLIFGGLTFYGVKQGYLAEVAFTKSLDAAAQGNLVETYNLGQEAISQNPYFDNYHRAYGQTNLVLMNTLAAKENLTDDDKTTIQALMQQAVREGKIVTENLSPADSRNWDLLGQIYRNLIGAAEGAENWAVSAYQQAVFLDPLNLHLRINLGGIFYQLKDYETAERVFRATVQLKSDFANARFNLAAALREQGKKEEARKELEAARTLVEEGSVDAQKVDEELEKLGQ